MFLRERDEVTAIAQNTLCMPRIFGERAAYNAKEYLVE